jgi:hypothetical protein
MLYAFRLISASVHTYLGMRLRKKKNGRETMMILLHFRDIRPLDFDSPKIYNQYDDRIPFTAVGQPLRITLLRHASFFIKRDAAR